MNLQTLVIYHYGYYYLFFIITSLANEFSIPGPIQALLTTYYSTYIDGIKAEQFDKSIIVFFSLLYDRFSQNLDEFWIFPLLQMHSQNTNLRQRYETRFQQKLKAKLDKL